MFARWSNYHTPDGARLFRERNTHCAHYTDQQIIDEATEVILVAAAVLGPLGEDLAALVGTE